MWSNYPIFFDTDEIKCHPNKWEVTYTNIYKSNQTEDGHDDIEYVRFGKATIATSFPCTSRMASLFRTYSEKPSFVVKYYEPKANTYTERTVHMEDIKESLEPLSRNTPGTTGLYTIEFTLYEL